MVRMPVNNKNLERLHIMKKVCRKEMKLNQAAKLLGLSKSQSIRFKKRHEQEGAAGLISQKLGTPSNNQIPEEHKTLVIKFLSQEDHRDFSPLLVDEYLSKEHAEFISISSVRNIMIRNGL